MRLSKKLFNKKFYLVIILILFLVGGYWWRQRQIALDPSIEKYQVDYLKSQFNPETEATTEPEIISENLPEKYLITDFPFQTQAPFANWDELHDEACEEASIILVKYYFDDEDISAGRMDQEILRMVDWEMKNFGGHFDLTAEQTLELAQKFYGSNGKVLTNVSIATIKEQIAAGQPVIVPTAGRLLGNPNFRGAGPIYHMVVAIGYDEKNIIVQDVGTRNGNHYVYNQKIFENAWHDWDENNIAKGPKNIIILSNPLTN